MTDIEQAARAAAVESLAHAIEAAWADPRWDGKTLRPIDRILARAALAWLSEFLLSDENVEKAARTLDPTAWLSPGYVEFQEEARVQARAALSAVLGKEQP